MNVSIDNSMPLMLVIEIINDRFIVDWQCILHDTIRASMFLVLNRILTI